jgi:magnesium transporter
MNEIVDEATNESKVDSLIQRWATLPTSLRLDEFEKLSHEDSEELFKSLNSNDQFELVEDKPVQILRDLVKNLDPDDAVDLLQHFEVERRSEILKVLDPVTCKELTALLAYQEDEAGGLMNPRFIRLRPDVSVDVAIRYLRAQSKRPIETIHYLYVLDVHQKLLGVLSFRDLIMAPNNAIINDIMESEVVSVPIDMDQEEISRLFSQTGLAAIPVLDYEGLMQGIITLDDVLEVVTEDATEDMQKMGGMESLESGYLQMPLFALVKKRAFWLSILFVGEMFTASAMRIYEHELQKAVVLAMFIPLIISSGGNSGSQATSLIMRALALGDLRLNNWSRVFFREIVCGLTLGAILAGLVWARISFYPNAQTIYGSDYHLLAIAVAAAVTGVVLWGNILGAMLPFLLKSIKLDPATASAPLVATLVDVTGLIIYFSVAKSILGL